MATGVDQQTIFCIVEEICSYFGNWRNVMAVIGAVYLLKKTSYFLFGLLRGFQTYFVSRLFVERNLKKICGGKWAVITGGSDGIGKAFAHELAKYKFDIVLISRSQTKLRKVAMELEECYSVEVKVIAADFSCTDKTMYKDIEMQLNVLDIGLLVNNVGIHYGLPSFFLDLTKQKLWDLVNVNVANMTMMTHMVLPGMVKRNSGAIINMSSSAAQLPSPLITVYSATKAYVDYISQGLAVEYSKNNITIQCLKPFYVSTAMTLHTSPNIFVPTATTYVQSALATLPYASVTCGFWIHDIKSWMFSSFPNWVWLNGSYYWHLLLRRWFNKKD